MIHKKRIISTSREFYNEMLQVHGLVGNETYNVEMQRCKNVAITVAQHMVVL